jgi:hypothetical protein
LLAVVHAVIKEHVPVPAVAFATVEAAKTQIPSDPAALQEVLVLYV